jgi:hypothetical protein
MSSTLRDALPLERPLVAIAPIPVVVVSLPAPPFAAFFALFVLSPFIEVVSVSKAIAAAIIAG